MRFIRPDSRPARTRTHLTKRDASAPDALRRKATWFRAAYVLVFALVLLIAFLASIIYFLSSWALKTFGTLTIRMVIFNLLMPMHGVETSKVSDAILHALLPAFMVTVTFAILVWSIGRGIRKFRSRRTIWLQPSELVPGLMLALAMLVVSASTVNQRFDIAGFIRDQNTQSTFIEQHYVEPARANLVFPERKRNLVQIFLESMETDYMDVASGGLSDLNHIPELTRLAAENVNFSNTGRLGGFLQAMNTNWTIAGMFSQSAGLPLTLPFDGNSMSSYVKFFPGVTSLGDILEDAGYKNVLMLGSDAVFGGRQQYYSQHGGYEILDYHTAINNGWIPPDYHVWWGYEDSKLYAFAQDELKRLAAGSQPFSLTLLTVDTHFEDGFVCSLCRNETDNQYANVLACGSRQAVAFIEWMKTQDFYKDTTIVVTGDHRTMDADFFEIADESDPRPIYNAFINAKPADGFEASVQKNREATSFDIFPTTLSAMGVRIPGSRLALGTDLFSGQMTLAETFGLEPLNVALGQKSTFFENKLFYGR